MSEHKHVNPWIVALAVMFATFMEVLDTTVVNVSLPHIASSMAATTGCLASGVPMVELLAQLAEAPADLDDALEGPAQVSLPASSSRLVALARHDR